MSLKQIRSCPHRLRPYRHTAARALRTRLPCVRRLEHQHTRARHWRRQGADRTTNQEGLAGERTGTSECVAVVPSCDRIMEKIPDAAQASAENAEVRQRLVN